MIQVMPEPPKLLTLDEADALPGPGTLRWHPVRQTLGVRAFGCNAYTASEAGADVVEPHVEGPSSDHQELYFVASGVAIFTIDEQRYEAPAGTYVFVPDPASRRHAVADEPGTTVLSFGGPPVFTPSAWEWAFRAAGTRGTDADEARTILEEGLRAHPDSASLLYERACLDAVQGRDDDALVALERAIATNPEIGRWARDDEDFRALRTHPGFRRLTDN